MTDRILKTNKGNEAELLPLKRPYTAPALTKYGDVVALTRGAAITSATDVAATSV